MTAFSSSFGQVEQDDIRFFARPIEDDVAVELLVDALNVLNDMAEEAVATDNLFSPNFGHHPTAFIDPRRVMFDVRLNLGGRRVTSDRT